MCNIRIKNGMSEIDELECLNSNNQNQHSFLDDFSSQFCFSSHFSPSKLLNENQEGCSVNMLDTEHSTESSEFAPGRPTSHHPSPICFEKYYREYMISLRACLEVLDNLPVKDLEREKAIETIKKYYEYVPYNRHFKESVVSILQKRETSGTSYNYASSKQPYSRGSLLSDTRSLAAAKVSSSTWPHLHPISKFRSPIEGIEIFRPRQFEYHPSNPSLMVFGTLDGELVVINHESQKLVGYLPSVGALHSILGLCWLKKHPSKGRGSGYSICVQSLRGDPYRLFHMSVLAAYLRPCTRSEIIKVNLLTSGDHVEDDPIRYQHTTSGMGG